MAGAVAVPWCGRCRGGASVAPLPGWKRPLRTRKATISITVALHHKTTYLYDRPVAVSPHLVRLRPAPHTRTPVVSYSLRVAPGNHFVNWQQDPHSNYVARFVFPDKVRKLEFEADLVAGLTIINPLDFFREPDAETFPFAYEPALARDPAPFLEVAPPRPLLRKWVASVDRSERTAADLRRPSSSSDTPASCGRVTASKSPATRSLTSMLPISHVRPTGTGG